MMNKQINILLIEDEDFDVRRVQNTIDPFLNKLKIVDIVSDGLTAIDMVKKNIGKYDVIVMDFQIAGGIRGEILIKSLKEINHSLQIIVITKMTINITDYDFAQRLIEAGAYWYCTKYPGDIEDYIYQPTDFILALINAYEKGNLEKESYHTNQKLSRNVEDILKQKKIIGESEATKKLLDEIGKYANSNVSILISGSSGTGKELVAFNIHYSSHRQLENFVPINCGSLPVELAESELFGYEKGAFTGADKRKSGLFEIADKGTLFLDEISELPLSAQVKLLRVLQEGEISKLGGTDKIKVDVRIIAATNKDLEKEVKEKRFREDLFYRLNVVPIYIKPLRERKSDIPILTEYFLKNFALDMGKEKPNLTEEALDFLINQRWTGNVRELKNVIQRMLFIDESTITLQHLKGMVGYNFGSQKNDIFNFSDEEEIQSLKDMEKIFREKYFEYVRQNSSSDSEAAKKLGLAPSNYYRMCKELGLK